MLPQRITFKGIRDGILVIVDAGAQLDELMEGLKERARLGRDFFVGATAILEVRDGELSGPALEDISKFLVSDMGFGSVRLSSSTGTPSVGRDLSQSGSTDVSPENRMEDIPLSTIPDAFADRTLLIKRTLRSGQKVNAQGNVVIMGDVNPGAEIIAGGDILVLGSLRGVAHAGATGNESSQVFALKLLPTQLRIANFIARPPDGDNRVPNAPEVASVKDNRLVIETYNFR